MLSRSLVGMGYRRSFSVQSKFFKFQSAVLLVPRKTLGVIATTGKMCRAAYRDPAVIRHWQEDISASIRHGVKWVKNGFKLFSKNVSISKKLLVKAAVGHQLTLRESKLLLTTTTDLFKLVPFSLFIIIPFAELALPVFLRLFPNMLPSTFIEKSFDGAAVARRVRARRELAEFFEHVLEEKNRQEIQRIATDPSGRHDIRELQSLLAKHEKSFPPVSELAKFGKLFEDEFRLEKMELNQLQKICKMLGLEPFAFKTHVVLQLRHYVNRLQAEDRRILWEGVDALTETELEEACHARGITVPSKQQLEHWLELSSCRQIPVSLLLWSRTSLPLVTEQASQPAEEEEEAEELFEETAERQKERADDLERRLENLEKMEQTQDTEPLPHEEQELDRDELVAKNEKLEEELMLLSEIVEKQERVFSDQIAFLAKLESVQWEAVGTGDLAKGVRAELAIATERFRSEIEEIDQLLEKSKNLRFSVDDHRFYPNDGDEGEAPKARSTNA